MLFAGLRTRAGLACALLALAGCGQTPPPVVGTMAAEASEAANQAGFSTNEAAEYRLQPSDTISVTVFREPDLSLAATPVGSDGTVSLPLVGSVHAEGRTTAELANEVESLLGRGYLTNPKVSINVMEYTSHRVTVEGAVREPGVYPFVPGARLSAAIALAKGPERVAKLDQVAVFRPTPEGMSIAKFDYRAMQQGTMIDPVLKPGDRVVVGTSGLSQFWQDALKALPAFALFTQF